MTDDGVAPLADWHPADVVAALKKRSLSISEVARRLGIKPSTAWHALRVPYPRVEREIAAAIGVPPDVIWPTRWAKRERQRRARELAA
jgi:Ner family transcriptional regulator